MLWVATIGMQRDCRDRLKNFSSPVGSLSPTVANAWYSSQRNRTCRKYALQGSVSIFGMRPRIARVANQLSSASRSSAPSFWDCRRPESLRSDHFTLLRFNQFRERRQRLAKLAVRIRHRVKALFGWTKDPLQRRVVIKQRQEKGNAFDNGGAQPLLNAHPVVDKPAADRFGLFPLVGIANDLGHPREGRRRSLAPDGAPDFQAGLQPGHPSAATPSDSSL